MVDAEGEGTRTYELMPQVCAFMKKTAATQTQP